MSIAALTLAAVVAVLPAQPGQRAPLAPPVGVLEHHSPALIDRAASHDAMRQPWEDHIIWTRLYIVSAAAGLPDVQSTAQRLLQNQVDIRNAIKPFYGEAAGVRLTALLRSHILIAADLVTAAKAGNAANVLSAGIITQFPTQFTR